MPNSFGWTQPDYATFITSEHRNKPNFIGVVETLTTPFAGTIATLASMPGLYDVDVAVGDQEDKVGEWVGVSRNLEEPLTGVYFSLDDAALGLDQGYLEGPFDPTSGVVALDDGTYRTLLLARIANNQWDGTVPSAYNILAPVFPGGTVILQDNQNMSMLLGVVGYTLDAARTAMLENGLLNLKPAAVNIAGYIISPALPMFGLDAESSLISGLDVGSLVTPTGGN